MLNNVFIPFGVVAEDPRVYGDGPEFTDYGVLKSPSEKLMLIRGYRNTQWRQIDLKKLDFTKPHYWVMEDGTLGITEPRRLESLQTGFKLEVSSVFELLSDVKRP